MTDRMRLHSVDPFTRGLIWRFMPFKTLRLEPVAAHRPGQTSGN
jgi:hypothetical protein